MGGDHTKVFKGFLLKGKGGGGAVLPYNSQEMEGLGRAKYSVWCPKFH